MESRSVHRWVWYPVLFSAVFGSVAVTAADLAPRSALLDQARSRMSENLARLPNYTCIETIERTRRDPAGRSVDLVDRMRLEVGLVDGKELFSWPGAARFDDSGVPRMVPGGLIASGAFALHARIVFQSRYPAFSFAGEQTLNGRHALRWNYVITRLGGGMEVGLAGHNAVVATHGSFWADADTLDLVRLDVATSQIPRDVPLRSVADSIGYVRTRIGGGEFLLPQDSELHMLDANNFESVNHVRFTSCREYVGESRVLDPGAAPASLPLTAATSELVELPPGTALDLSLETPVRFETAAVGDPLTFRLRRAVKHAGQVLFDRGSVVHGRLTLLQKKDPGIAGFAVGIDLLEIEASGRRAKVKAKFDRRTAQTAADGGLGFVEYSERRLALPRASGSVFFQPGTSEVLRRSVRMVWHTVRETVTRRED